MTLKFDDSHKTLICVAPNGAFKQKHDHPNIPISIDEVASTAIDCYKKGARMIHFHLRDENGKHLLDAPLYQQAIDLIKTSLSAIDGNDMIVQVTTESAQIYTPEQQIQCMRELIPDAFSLSIRELFSDKALYSKALEFISWSFANNIYVQFIIYDSKDLDFYLNLLNNHDIDNRYTKQDVLFVLGRYVGNSISIPQDIIPLIHAYRSHSLTKDWPWMCCAFGPYEYDCLASAMLLGGNVRVGFENSLSNQFLKPAKDNAELVQQAADFIDCHHCLRP